MSCCNSLVNGLKKVLKKLGPILAIALAFYGAYLVFAKATALTLWSGVSWLPAGIETLTLQSTTVGYLALGASLVVNPEAVGDLAGSIADGAGQVAGKVVAGAAAGIGAGVSNALFGTDLTTLLVVGGLAWFLFFRKRPSDDKEKNGAETTLFDDYVSRKSVSGASSADAPANASRKGVSDASFAGAPANVTGVANGL